MTALQHSRKVVCEADAVTEVRQGGLAAGLRLKTLERSIAAITHAAQRTDRFVVHGSAFLKWHIRSSKCKRILKSALQ